MGPAMEHDTWAGFHQFHAEETQEPYGSLEVFWRDEQRPLCDDWGYEDPGVRAGWYWWACFPGCLPDGEPSGPFATSRDALQDADEWHPEFDEPEDIGGRQ